jgi:hypothetical protein
VFATHDDPGYCHALPYVNQVSLAALVNSVPGMGSGVMNIAMLGAGAMGCLFGGRLAEAEVDYLNGAVVREAEALGMAVPVTAALWHLVGMREPAA